MPKHVKKGDKGLRADYLAGKKIYERESHCATCHQDHGNGMPKIYPPLAGSEWVTGDKENLIKLVLHGLYGPIEVKGVKYSPENGLPPMTAFGSILDDNCLLYTSPSPRDKRQSRMPSSA